MPHHTHLFLILLSWANLESHSNVNFRDKKAKTETKYPFLYPLILNLFACLTRFYHLWLTGQKRSESLFVWDFLTVSEYLLDSWISQIGFLEEWIMCIERSYPSTGPSLKDREENRYPVCLCTCIAYTLTNKLGPVEACAKVSVRCDIPSLCSIDMENGSLFLSHCLFASFLSSLSASPLWGWELQNQ